MGLNCDPVDGYSSGKVSGQTPDLLSSITYPLVARLAQSMRLALADTWPSVSLLEMHSSIILLKLPNLFTNFN